ncbi:hypothetical protein G5B38_04375 [Pseudohalocynthiibacter aestuariivivens]|nr:hypothetical protein G5B38_04375 [Pseudohalocynthiibacter aestuariivivens]
MVLIALAAMVVSSVSRATEDSQIAVRGLSGSIARRTTMQKVGFVALLVLMLGVTSGFLGGL